jgi:hypothetical protein
LFQRFDTFGSQLREEGSLGYNGGHVRFRDQKQLDTHLHRQQAPFSGAVYEEQVIKIQSSTAFVNIFSFSHDFSFASLNIDHPKKSI